VATAADVLRVAASELGYTETPVNRTKFAAEAGHPNGAPWCMTFVQAMFKRAGQPLPANSASCAYVANGFQSQKRYSRDPKVGDVVFFNFPGESGLFDHTGILESFTATTVTCVEGNTSKPDGTNPGGGGVWRKTRPRSVVIGYGHPAYSATPAPAPPAAPEGVFVVNSPLVAVLSHPSGGYLEVCADGGVFVFGGAPFLGSLGGTVLNKPVVGGALTPSGKGYWLVASDGGVFTFGDAQFFGSTGAVKLNKPIIGMSATSTGLGYRLYASDGGVFCFGDARFDGTVQYAG
jgi:hypothetical protein